MSTENNPILVFDYNTEHDTANRTMTHSFQSGLQLCVNWEEKTIISAKNGRVIEKVTDFLMEAYERALINMAEADVMNLSLTNKNEND